jgi:hypothetical protein
MKPNSSRVPGTYKNRGTFEEKVAREDREMAANRAKNESVPGSRKNSASFQEKTLRNPTKTDTALKDARVLDEEYDYTKVSWPGKMQPDLNLDRGEVMQIRHKPQTNADTNE